MALWRRIVSTLGAMSSFTFSFIAIGLCISMMAGGHIYGRAGGIVYSSTANKARGFLWMPWSAAASAHAFGSASHPPRPPRTHPPLTAAHTLLLMCRSSK